MDKLPALAPNRTIAIIDTGMDATHPDLAAVVVAGADVTGTNVGTDDPAGHGTHVAGIAGAATNDGYGMAGMAPNARIMPIRIMKANGDIKTKFVAKGIKFAFKKGAHVINMSFGFNKSNAKVADEIDNAADAGLVLVASAGNSNQSKNKFPASDSAVISVGASDAFLPISAYRVRRQYRRTKTRSPAVKVVEFPEHANHTHQDSRRAVRIRWEGAPLHYEGLSPALDDAEWTLRPSRCK
jgi:subtilisin family serine protease